MLERNFNQKGYPIQEYHSLSCISWAGLTMTILADYGCQEQDFIDQGFSGVHLIALVTELQLRL
jgi:hypothetical protein